MHTHSNPHTHTQKAPVSFGLSSQQKSLVLLLVDGRALVRWTLWIWDSVRGKEKQGLCKNMTRDSTTSHTGWVQTEKQCWSLRIKHRLMMSLDCEWRRSLRLKWMKTCMCLRTCDRICRYVCVSVFVCVCVGFGGRGERIARSEGTFSLNHIRRIY